ncbi:MAG: hypothetical protein ACE15C_02320 [Phycisphaerae bacterium]
MDKLERTAISTNQASGAGCVLRLGRTLFRGATPPAARPAARGAARAVAWAAG